MKKVMMCLALALALSVNAFALEVPTDTVVQNLNGSQQVIKTFTVAPDTDPQELIEEPFELEGYLYTFANIVKKENVVDESKIHTEVITLETEQDDLALILGQFAVEVGVLSADVILFMAFVAIANFTQPSFELGYAFKLLRLFLLTLIALFDVWGFWLGLAGIFVLLLTNKTVSKTSYLYPLIPFNGRKLKDALLRTKADAKNN